MSDHLKKNVQAATLVPYCALDIPGKPVVHRLEKPWRAQETLRKETKFAAHLESLACLPAPNKLLRILRIANECGLPEIAHRANLSRLEDEFLVLIGAIISNPEKEWVRTLSRFLDLHGWKVDLRGSPRKHPLELEDRMRGKRIDEIKGRIKRGFDLKLSERKKPGFSSDNEEIEKKLRKQKYSPVEIKAIMRGHNLCTAACYYYWKKYEPQKKKKSILNSYRQYFKATTAQIPK